MDNSILQHYRANMLHSHGVVVLLSLHQTFFLPACLPTVLVIIHQDNFHLDESPWRSGIVPTDVYLTLTTVR